MRMAELSAGSGVPVATVKYYLREGLLPPGERTSPNQARYGEEHVRRLKLIRALVDVGGLSVAAVGQVLAAVDERESPYEVLGVVQNELAGPPPEIPDEDREWTLDLLADVARQRGWKFEPGNRTVAQLAGVLHTIRALGHDQLIGCLGAYADLAAEIAEVDVASVTGMPSLERIVEAGVVGTVLGDRLFTGLRHLAQEGESRKKLAERSSSVEGGGGEEGEVLRN